MIFILCCMSLLFSTSVIILLCCKSMKSIQGCTIHTHVHTQKKLLVNDRAFTAASFPDSPHLKHTHTQGGRAWEQGYIYCDILGMSLYTFIFLFRFISTYIYIYNTYMVSRIFMCLAVVHKATIHLPSSLTK